MTTGGVKGLDVISDWSIVKIDLTTSGNPEQLFTLVNRIPFFLTFLLFYSVPKFELHNEFNQISPKKKNKSTEKIN